MIQSQNYNGIIADRPDEPYHSGRSWMQPLEIMQETTLPAPDFHRPRFATIDDMLELARKLVDGLDKLGERKYPLDIRRGVRNMVERTERKGEMLKTPSKTYFFDIKETKEHKPFLVITESRLMGEGEKPERSSIMVFQNNLQEFAEIVSQLAEKYGEAKSS
jgi:hypothetical protein